ncbi:MAG: S8 family serine peptidase [Planctomycetota bacterium]|jgi:subtilisin family serine protease
MKSHNCLCQAIATFATLAVLTLTAVPSVWAETIVCFPLDTDPGWSTEAQWAFGAPLGGGSDCGDPTSGHTGANVYGYNLAGNYTNGMPAYYLTTTPLSCSGYENITLSFWRRLGIESASFDHAKVEVSNNGSVWTSVWEHIGGSFCDGAWVECVYDISAVADNQPTVYIRWTMGPTDGSVTYPGWNIDDICLLGNPIDDLYITPSEGLISSGYQGGPFSPSHKTYTLTNTGTSALDWTAGATQPWLDVGPNNSTLNPGDSNTVVVSFNANANTLASGDYSSIVTFTNTTSGIAQTRNVMLQVLPAGLVFYDTFPSTTLDGTKWTICTGAPTIDAVGIGEPSPPYSLRLNGHPSGGDCVESRIINLSGLAEAELTYWYERTGGGEDPDTDEDLVIEYWNGLDWVELERQLGNGPDMTSYSQSLITLPPGALHGDFRLRISSTGTDHPTNVYDDWFVDDISIVILDDLGVTPPEDFNSSGYEGGPFIPSDKVYRLTNSGTSLLNWTASATQPWLDVQPGSGILNPSDYNLVSISLGADANALPPGDYSDIVTFTNTTSGFVQMRNVRLQVVAVPGEIEVTDSILPADDNEMPFGDVIVGLSRTEHVTITNTDPDHELIVDIFPFVGLFDDFPETTINPENWTDIVSSPVIDDVGIDEPSPPYSLRLNGDPDGGEAVMSRIIDLSGSSGLNLIYWYQRTGGGEDPDSGEDLVFSYWNDSYWEELSRHLGDGPDMVWYEEVVVPLPVDAYHDGFRLQISNTGSDCNCDDWFVDDVSITMENGDAVFLFEDNHTFDQNDIVIGEAFHLENLPNFPVAIPPLGSISFDVNFVPDEPIDYNTTLLIASDDRDEPEVEVRLSGRCILDYLEIIPDANCEFSGHPGGPFVPTYHYYQLTNIGPVNIDWIAEPNVPWLNMEPNSGTLDPCETITITIMPNAQAQDINEGHYCSHVNFTNVNTTVNQTRQLCLNVYTEPKIWASPYSFDINVPQGCSETRILTIGNTGGSPLDFTLTAELTRFTPASQEPTSASAAEANDIVLSAPSGHDFTVLADDAAFAPGRLLVRFASQTDGTWSDIAQKSAILDNLNGATIERDYKIVPGLSLIELPAGTTVEEALVSFNQTDAILYAQPDYELTVDSDEQYIPNDPLFDDLWGMHNTGQTGGTADADIDAPEAWDIVTGSGDVIVAVIDTGVDYTHLDLAANMWVNGAELNGTPGVDDDGNGYIDDTYGYDFYNNDGDPWDDHYHGTHCAGTVGAAGNNGVGVTGVCWNVKIMALKWMSSSGSGYTSAAIACVEYSTLMGANLSSNSWRQVNTNVPNPALEDAIIASGNAGMLFVASAGNDSTDNDVIPHYPSSYDCENIIAVLSTDKYDNKSGFSCYGLTSVDLGAPGSDILSCEPGGGYQYLDGTSMATPHVAGACALVWSVCPSLTNLQVKDIILRTVDPLPVLNGLCVSGGRLNLHQAILEAEALCEASGGGWIEFITEIGTVAAGATMDVNVIFDGNRPAGSYEGFITISSTDPYEPNVIMPATMTVEPIDYLTELFDPDYLDPNDPNHNDMTNRTLTFRQDGSYSYYNACISEANDFPIDPNGGTIIALEDDDYEQIQLDGAFIGLYGTDYDTFYVGSNGYISFVSGDIRHFESFEDHFALPRISGLFDDLDPSAGGTISWKQLDDRVVVTFENVPEYALSNSNSFQVEMRFNGKVRITLLDIAARDGLVGLSAGDGVPLYFAESDLSEYDLCTFVGDLNGDIDVDLADLAIFGNYWQNQHEHTETIRDEFEAVSYGGSNGTQNWNGDWQEIGESDGPENGFLQVVPDGSMRVGHENAKDQPTFSLTREANLSGATTATLTYDYVAQNNGNDGSVSVQVSGDWGLTWDTLVTYPYDAGSGSASFDISSYISSDTQIRFELASETKIKMYLYVDNIQIEYDDPEHPWYPWCGGSDFNRDFRINFGDLLTFCEHYLE